MSPLYCQSPTIYTVCNGLTVAASYSTSKVLGDSHGIYALFRVDVSTRHPLDDEVQQTNITVETHTVSHYWWDCRLSVASIMIREFEAKMQYDSFTKLAFFARG
mmetsp:Transcript_1361/g.2981  ORF Transcript_1361/g.2981 Transcript_1361/m.2981 type:complete len:104 (+) Transcript_1361:199-510(+)